MTKLKKWQLLEATDISPSPYFPLEKRKYQRPDGQVVDDFYVTTIADSVNVVPVTKNGKVVMIRMYKQGIDQIVIQFPAGRFESKHADFSDAAIKELEEEAGIKIDPSQLIFIRKQAVMTTKSSEMIHLFLAKDVEFNSQQHFDDNEEIEVLELDSSEVETMILSGEIIEASAISDWYLVKGMYPELLK